MTNLLLTIIIFLLLCLLFGTANVLYTLIGIIVFIVVAMIFEASIKHIWSCIK